jgi:cysteine desulfurase/selenocysteine lyase
MKNEPKGFEIQKVRNDFPFLKQNKIVYFDSAATSLKPKVVVDRVSQVLSYQPGNPGRSSHQLAYSVFEQVEKVREALCEWIKAKSKNEIVLTHGASHALQMILRSFVHDALVKDDEIWLTNQDHHSVYLPLLRLQQENKNIKPFQLRVIPILKNGAPDTAFIKKHLSKKVKLLCLPLISNLTGMVTPIEWICSFFKDRKTALLLDAVQAPLHLEMDVAKWNCDFLTLSAHKMCGPSGAGLLYIAQKWHEKLSPVEMGGGTITSVRAGKYQLKEMPASWEVGTLAIESILGWGSALSYLKKLDRQKILVHEQNLQKVFIRAASQISKLEFVGLDRKSLIEKKTLDLHTPLFSLVYPQIHSHDLSHLLSENGFAVRGGFHCVYGYHQQHSHLLGSTRISLAFYNTPEEVISFFDTLKLCLKQLQ